MTRVLFLCEAVTWSQVARLAVLARGLDRSFAVTFASADFDRRFFSGTRFSREPIHSLSPREVDRRVRRGGRIYDRTTLDRYVGEELALIDRIKPDVIVSDLRWSTTVSAPLRNIPLVTLIDGYWFRPLERYPIPDHWTVRLFGAKRVGSGFAKALPYVMAHLAEPVNELRVAHGLSSLGELKNILGFGDRLVFPDDSAIVESDRSGVHLGPIPFSPNVPLPSWWDFVGVDRPLVYLTLGSSGPLSSLPNLLEAVAPLDVDVVLSTAARGRPDRIPSNVRVVDLVPGDLACARASVVVCSGGASTAWQALSAGTPIVGVPGNLDAALAMSCIESAGLGVGLRPEDSVATMRAAIAHVLGSEKMKQRAGTAAASAARYDPQSRFREVLESLSGSSWSAESSAASIAS